MTQEEVKKLENRNFKRTRLDNTWQRNFKSEKGVLNVLVFKDSSWGYMIRIVFSDGFRDIAIKKRFDTLEECLDMLKNNAYEPVEAYDAELIGYLRNNI